MPGVASYGQGVAAICAGVRKGVHGVGSDSAIHFDAGFHAHTHGMARTGSGKLFLAGRLINDRSAGGDGQVGSHVFDQNFLLGAKAAADPWFDDANAFDWQSQHWRQDAAGVERNLGTGAYYQAWRRFYAIRMFPG